VTVVRRGVGAAPRGRRGAFLLLDSDTLLTLDPETIAPRIRGRRAGLVRLRLHDVEADPVHETVVTDRANRLLRIRRFYPAPRSVVEVHATSRGGLARRWHAADDSDAGRVGVRRAAHLVPTTTLARHAGVLDATRPGAARRFLAWSGSTREPEASPAPLDLPTFPARPRPGKRLFDIVLASAAIVAAAPLLPIIAGAIWLEDGGPILYRHRRERRGGRPFVCYKFRTMRRDADAMKAGLAPRNVCDGPQFHIEDDPRLLRTGRVLRRFHLDELPQFVHVLLGQMSLIGPRPSPEDENQLCPAWREARLSLRPGLTGLWQVRRTRARGCDFQEWIRYDLEYVERQSWRLDLWILGRTVVELLPRRLRRGGPIRGELRTPETATPAVIGRVGADETDGRRRAA
jgi:lipopolysaccharide/colanic/teichoic acid biosynthesis glycosyltransferase